MKFAVLGVVLLVLIAFLILMGLCFAGYRFYYKQNNPAMKSGSDEPGREQNPENSVNPSVVVQVDVEVQACAPPQSDIGEPMWR